MPELGLRLTRQAVRALNRVDAFFVIDKGEEKSDLVQLRVRSDAHDSYHARTQ